MSTQLDPKVQKAMELLQAKSKHFDTAEEALKEAQENPVVITEQLQDFFDDIVQDKTRCSRVAFYVPDELIQKLTELEKQGIEPNELVTTAIQSAIHTIKLSLAVARNTVRTEKQS